MKRYKYIDHTADIAIVAVACNLEEAFECAAEAMFDIITDNAEIKPLRQFEFELEADSQESLLVNFLSRLVTLHEIEQVVFGQFEVSFPDDFKVKAMVSGEKFDERRHGGGHHVKGVTYHMLEISRDPQSGDYRLQVLFDV